MTDANYYKGFEYSSAELTKYIEAAGVFTILLISGSVVHFFPESKDGFREWLQSHSVPSIRDY